MEEEDLSERGLTIASIMNRVRDLKNKYKNEDNITDELNFTKVSADTTGLLFFPSLSPQFCKNLNIVWKYQKTRQLVILTSFTSTLYCW
uniref:Uncharacterized protein n=1 Tax=Chelonoidis abingdonii TaxID=106734 RepID=A0A8C0GRB9_CHEAB